MAKSLIARKRSSGVNAYVEAMKQEQSSIGDVKTLRSQLQARRSTLNAEIEKEDRFMKGSKNLVGASADLKTREQATLEMSFAESKIKALQAELGRINSSLHAYQAESARSSQVPLIPLAQKTTTKISFVATLSDLISKHYFSNPADFQDSIYDFQELRYSVSSVAKDESGIEVLFEYYNQLQLMSRRFIHPNLRHGIVFIWYDAINGMPAAQQSVTFEKACILFNIAALYTQLAAQLDRSSAESIDKAVTYLEKAIGVFEFMKAKFSHSPTMDMSAEMLALFSDIMRAQAHEMQWEKQSLAGLEEDLPSLMDHAHRTKSVAECYRPVRELLDDKTMREYLPDCWTALIKIKEAHYKALAHYYTATAHKSLAKSFSNGGQVPEEMRTELHFLYTDATPEIMSCEPSYHIGLLKSHLNCASLSHEYAVKYNNLCRDLHHITPLIKVLREAEERSRLLQQEVTELEGVTVIAPTIHPLDVSLTAIVPDFTVVRVTDLFRALGPLPEFSAENKWSPPRAVLITRGEAGFGFSVRGSRPVFMSSVDQGSPAALAGVLEKDWILSVNGANAKNKSHDVVVTMVKECGDEVAMEITTPEPQPQSE